MSFKKPQIVGVVNITSDSFSDGGLYLNTNDAIKHAEKLLHDGADILDLGAAASNPHAQHVPAQIEIRRLTPVIEHLRKRGARISIDSTKPEVQHWALAQNVEFLNDIRGFPDPSMYLEFAHSNVKLVVMHYISDLDKAVRRRKDPKEVLDSIHLFFAERLAALRAAGVRNEQLIVDPGMGFFLASNPEPSLAVLARLSEIKKEFGLPIMIGVSRKSFLKNVPARTTGVVRSGGAEPETCDIQARTLAAELYSAEQGVAYIRTHDVRPLCEGLLPIAAIHRML